MSSDFSTKSYHIEITLKVSEPPHRLIEHASDLTIEALEGRFLGPYRRGTPIVIRGRTIQMDEVHRVRVYESQEKIGHHDQLPKGNIAEVTDQFITEPPAWQLEELRGDLRNVRPPADTRDVFVVHGRNNVARQAMFDFLRSIGLHPLEWSEAVKTTGKTNPYIGEILNSAFSKAHAIVVLFTPDDEARLREQFRGVNEPLHETELIGQARPNVLFEAGMAMGWSEDRTVLVELGTLRSFSDVAGRHVIRLDSSTQRRQDLAQRLEAAGCPVNTGGTDWHTTGDFLAAINSMGQVSSETDTTEEQPIPSTSQMSEEAIGLLVEAAKDRDGVILVIWSVGGLLLETNGKGFVRSGDARSEAKWEQAVMELLKKGYVTDRSGDGEVFKVTQLGFEAADSLEASN